MAPSWVRVFGGRVKDAAELLPPRWQPYSVRARPRWRIGMYAGSSPVALHRVSAEAALTRRQVSDVPAGFVADPFMIFREGRWCMFFEVWNRRSGKGEIAVAESRDGLSWTYLRVVLREPFHLSYPYVFTWQGVPYLVPECETAGALRLYRAEVFPTRWQFVSDLLVGGPFRDASLFSHDGHWYCLAETSPHRTHDTLRLFHAEDLLGPWCEHPDSPVLERNPHIARPAGRIVEHAGRLLRFSQDCYPAYGARVYASEIEQVSPTAYRERLLGQEAVLAGEGSGWNPTCAHHVDPHRLDDGTWLAAVDGN